MLKKILYVIITVVIDLAFPQSPVWEVIMEVLHG